MTFGLNFFRLILLIETNVFFLLSHPQILINTKSPKGHVFFVNSSIATWHFTYKDVTKMNNKWRKLWNWIRKAELQHLISLGKRVFLTVIKKSGLWWFKSYKRTKSGWVKGFESLWKLPWFFFKKIIYAHRKMEIPPLLGWRQ